MSDNLIKVSKSRVAKKGVEVPSAIAMIFTDGLATFSNASESLSIKVPFGVDLVNESGKLFVVERSKNYLRFAGTIRSVIAHFVEGLTKGFSKNLKLVGVGYKASVSLDTITMNLGYSHPVVFNLPRGVSAIASSPTELKISSHNLVLLGDTVAKITRLRKKDSYKGKGIRDISVPVILKEGKKK